MTLIARAISTIERLPLPDAVTSAGIYYLVANSKRRLARVPAESEAEFVDAMTRYLVASHVDRANEQHYELPPEFFVLILGPRCKYSCCLYPAERTTLAEAERLAIDETVARADLADGQSILELGCGWGSLSLSLAERFPNSRIVAVSNSHPQRTFITRQARARGFSNLTVVTADMNAFEPEGQFDRVVSVEMFEHMSNWRDLLSRVRAWLRPDGRLFLHVFTHASRSYRFDHADAADWIAQHFFTGGIMPAHDLPHRFSDLFTVEAEWRWSGTHYQRTATDWLANFDANEAQIMPILKQVYGADAGLWRRRWRMFFLATAGLFGHAGGQEWGIGHYRLAATANKG